MLGWLVLFALTSLAAIASVAAATRAHPEGRAELGLFASVIFYALIVGPVLALGFTGLLTPVRLGVLALLLFSAVLAVSLRGARSELRPALVSLARLPLDAIVECARARSLVLVGLAAAAVMIALSAWVSYLAPSEGWDGLFYHEPIVGFALQNHGFSKVPLQPNPMVQTINGYPKGGEALAVWFVIFTDRTFIEIGNTLASPCLMLAVFALARRYGDRVVAIGWSCVALFVPAMWTQLPTAYPDIEISFYLVASVYFATRPTLRFHDAVVASLAMALLLATKGTGLTLVPPIAAVAFVRVALAHRRTRLRASLAYVAVSVLAFAGIAALTLVPNALVFHNPIWPVTYDDSALGIHFKGLIRYQDMNPHPSLRDWIATKYGVPKAGLDDVIVRDFGYAVPWVVLPLGAFALALGALSALRELVFERRAGMATNLLLVTALGIVAASTSNSWNSARFNMLPIVACMVGITWFASRRRWTRFGEGAVAAAVAMSIVPFAWIGDWYWGPSAATLRKLRVASREERASAYSDPSNMGREVALCREKELGPGDLVVFTKEHTWLGTLWNFDFSNVIRYVPFDDAARFAAKLDELRPKWVVVGGQSDARKLLEQRANDWELVGVAVNIDGTVAFRRRAAR